MGVEFFYFNVASFYFVSCSTNDNDFGLRNFFFSPQSEVDGDGRENENSLVNANFSSGLQILSTSQFLNTIAPNVISAPMSHSVLSSAGKGFKRDSRKLLKKAAFIADSS